MVREIPIEDIVVETLQRLLGHRDVKTTITVYNSVDSEYIRQTIDQFNERVKEDQMLLNDKKREEILEQRKDEFVADMDDDEFDEILTKLLEERKERKRRRESDMEMQSTNFAESMEFTLEYVIIKSRCKLL